jgi:hypothetical protein
MMRLTIAFIAQVSLSSLLLQLFKLLVVPAHPGRLLSSSSMLTRSVSRTLLYLVAKMSTAPDANTMRQ